MERLGEDLWVHEDRMRLGAGHLRLRMTVVKLSDGGLWLHSPTAISAQLREEVDGIGEVRCIIGPNNAHNLWLNEWAEAYPAAKLYVTPGIPKKIGRDDCIVMDEACESLWPADFEVARMPGVSFFDELIFLHKKTASVLITDLIQNHSDEPPGGLEGFMIRWVLRPVGFRDICIAPPFRLGFIRKDKRAFSEFIRTIQSWTFERIIVTHGDIIDRDAMQVFSGLTHRFLVD